MKLECEVNRTRVKVSWYIFRSFTGKRWVNGRPFRGSYFYLGTNRKAGRT